MNTNNTQTIKWGVRSEVRYSCNHKRIKVQVKVGLKFDTYNYKKGSISYVNILFISKVCIFYN